jgi:predicted transcriptional regulator
MENTAHQQSTSLTKKTLSSDFSYYSSTFPKIGLFLNKGYIEEMISYGLVVRVVRAEHYRRLKIMAQILTSAQGNGATKTEITYAASLSHAKAEDYLSVLIDTGLLEYDDEIQLYRTTDKGMRFLIDYKKKSDESFAHH